MPSLDDYLWVRTELPALLESDFSLIFLDRFSTAEAFHIFPPLPEYPTIVGIDRFPRQIFEFCDSEGIDQLENRIMGVSSFDNHIVLLRAWSETRLSEYAKDLSMGRQWVAINIIGLAGYYNLEHWHNGEQTYFDPLTGDAWGPELHKIESIARRVGGTAASDLTGEGDFESFPEAALFAIAAELTGVEITESAAHNLAFSPAEIQSHPSQCD